MSSQTCVRVVSEQSACWEAGADRLLLLGVQEKRGPVGRLPAAPHPPLCSLLCPPPPPPGQASISISARQTAHGLGLERRCNRSHRCKQIKAAGPAARGASQEGHGAKDSPGTPAAPPRGPRSCPGGGVGTLSGVWLINNYHNWLSQRAAQNPRAAYITGRGDRCSQNPEETAKPAKR